MTHALILGREPLLSVAECEAVLRVFGQDARMTVLAEDVVSFDCASRPEEVFARLGGSIKLGRKLAETDVRALVADPVAWLMSDEFLRSAFDEQTSGAFALNVYGDVPGGFRKQIKRIGIEWKKQLRGKLGHVRFVENKESTTSSVTVRRNKLLRGCDLWMVFAQELVHVFKTIDVQDYQEFGRRDFDRPMRNARAGMLPPKLARMMVNLSGVKAGAVLLDPFVGSGTVLQEAALVGISNLYGSDIEKRAMQETESNMHWLKETYARDYSLSLQQKGIAELDPEAYLDITHIVTEIDLGTPRSSQASSSEARQSGKSAEELLSLLMTFAGRLPSLQTIVVAIPFWPTKEGNVFTPLPKTMAKKLACDFSRYDRFFPQEYSTRGGLLYAREDQFVGREILVLA